MDYSTNGAVPIVCPYNKKKKKKKKKRKEKKFEPFLRTYSNLKVKTVKTNTFQRSYRVSNLGVGRILLHNTKSIKGTKYT